MIKGDVIAVGVIVLLAGFLRVVLDGLQPVHLQIHAEKLCHVGHGAGERVIQPGGGDQEQNIRKECCLAAQYQHVAYNNNGGQPQPEEHLPGGDQTGRGRFR